MTDLWGVQGANLDQGYLNLRTGASNAEAQVRAAVDALWAVYEPYADPGFAEGFARDPDARFWEMRLGTWLLESGKALLPTAERLKAGGQPDLCILDGGGRVWIEAIAPMAGEAGPDQVVGPVPVNEGGGLAPVPTRQVQLRTTSALYTKGKKIEAYLAQGVIAPDEPRLVAVSPCRFPLYVAEEPLPLVLTSVFPLGEEYVTINPGTGEVLDQGFAESLQIQRADGKAVPRTAFLEDTFAHVSGIAWSRYSLGGMDRAARPLSLVHNPKATTPIPQGWGVWDREFVTTPDGDDWTTTDILAAVPAAAATP